MKSFGKETGFIVIRNMVAFVIKQADIVTGAAKVLSGIPETARKFCRGEKIPFKTGREQEADDIGERLLLVCEAAEELSVTGANVARGVEAARISLAEVLTDILLRKSCKGADVIGRVKLPFLQAFNTLLQYEFLGGEG